MYKTTIHVIMTMKTVSHVGIIVVGHIIFFQMPKDKTEYFILCTKRKKSILKI